MLSREVGGRNLSEPLPLSLASILMSAWHREKPVNQVKGGVSS